MIYYYSQSLHNAITLINLISQHITTWIYHNLFHGLTQNDLNPPFLQEIIIQLYFYSKSSKAIPS